MKIIFLVLTILLAPISLLMLMMALFSFSEGSVFAGFFQLFFTVFLSLFTWLSYRGFKGKYGIADLIDSDLDANTPLINTGKTNDVSIKPDETAYVDESPIYQFDYFDSKGNYSQRRIKVKSIQRKNGELYLNALDLKKHASRTFKVANMDSLMLEETGEIINDNQVEAHFSGALA